MSSFLLSPKGVCCHFLTPFYLRKIENEDSVPANCLINYQLLVQHDISVLVMSACSEPSGHQLAAARNSTTSLCRYPTAAAHVIVLADNNFILLF
jgi:hypothetical protein